LELKKFQGVQMPFPIEDKYVIETEQLLGRKLPKWYKDRMMKDNGGEYSACDDDWELYPILNNASTQLISRTCNHVIKETGSAKEFPDFPKDALTIAGNGTGDQLILLPMDDEYFSETVHMWHHDSGEYEIAW
jgi:hypothetical protein